MLTCSEHMNCLIMRPFCVNVCIETIMEKMVVFLAKTVNDANVFRRQLVNMVTSKTKKNQNSSFLL